MREKWDALITCAKEVTTAALAQFEEAKFLKQLLKEALGSMKCLEGNASSLKDEDVPFCKGERSSNLLLLRLGLESDGPVPSGLRWTIGG